MTRYSRLINMNGNYTSTDYPGLGNWTFKNSVQVEPDVGGGYGKSFRCEHTVLG